MPDLCNVPALSLLILFGELIATVLTLASERPDWDRFGWMSLFVQWIVLASAGGLCVTRSSMARWPMRAGATAAWLLIVVVALLLTAIGEQVVFGEIRAFDLARNSLLAAVIGGMALRYFFVQQQWRLEQASALQSRIQALQSRIRPHFLFNSMNIIASLIPVDPDNAEVVVEDLSALFRASLNEAGNQVPLADELDLCQRYLHIESLRLDERLHIEWHVDALPQGLRIPQLTLQPLIENAIYHGIQPLPQGGTVSIAVAYVSGRVEVQIRNPVPAAVAVSAAHGAASSAVATPSVRGNGMALHNIRNRLEALYGATVRLDSARRGDVWEVTLQYPFALPNFPTNEATRAQP